MNENLIRPLWLPLMNVRGFDQPAVLEKGKFLVGSSVCEASSFYSFDGVGPTIRSTAQESPSTSHLSRVESITTRKT
jgi:hypothetical protein